MFRLADRLSFAQGAALGVPYFTAYRAIFIKYKSLSTFTSLFSIETNGSRCLLFCYRGKAKAGDRVLVHGASGAVGLAACQIAKAHGN